MPSIVQWLNMSDQFWSNRVDEISNSRYQEQNQAYNSAEALKARDFASEEAQKQRDFEAAMSSTAIRRAYEDYKSTGLSPLLMFRGMNGASTPAGASAQPTSAISSAAQARGADNYGKTLTSAMKIIGILAS